MTLAEKGLATVSDEKPGEPDQGGQTEPKIAEFIDQYFYPSLRLSVSKNLSQVSRYALYHLECYVNGLILQWNRIGIDQKRAWENGAPRPQGEAWDQEKMKAVHRYNDRVLLDIHFYLVCWDKINKYLGRFVENEKANKCISAVWDDVKDLTEKASRGRDYFEHLYERLTEKNFGKWRSGFSGSGILTFQYVNVSNKGKEIVRNLSLGKKEVEKITNAYEELLSCLKPV